MNGYCVVCDDEHVEEVAPCYECKIHLCVLHTVVIDKKEYCKRCANKSQTKANPTKNATHTTTTITTTQKKQPISLIGYKPIITNERKKTFNVSVLS